MRQLGKIAVSLGQVISSYARVYMIPWPESFNVMFNAFEVRQRDSLGPPRSPLGFVLYVRRADRHPRVKTEPLRPPFPQVFNLKVFTFPGLACVVRSTRSRAPLLLPDSRLSQARAVSFSSVPRALPVLQF